MDPNPVPSGNADSQASVRPVSARERIGEIDVLRGWAIFGMFLINTGSLGGYWRFPQQWTGMLDRVTVHLLTILAEDKFFTLFAFLFGLGFGIQLWRAEVGGSHFIPIYMRRLVVLFLIGLSALLFIAPVLVLISYALLGFVLLMFRNCQPQTLLRIAFVCLLIPFASEAVVATRTSLRADNPQLEQQWAAQDKGRAAKRAERRSESIRVNTEGTYRELMVWRARFGIAIYSDTGQRVVTLLGNTLPIFLLGLWAGRRRIFENLSTQLPFVRKVLWWGMAIGFGGTLASLAVRDWLDLGTPMVTEPLATLLWNFGRPGLCFFYAAGLVLLAQRQHWKRRLTPLAAVGRMALSNYLLQLVVFALVFPAYGLGLYGRIGPALGVAFAVLAFGAQIFWSIWWIRRFRYGPAEWLWRVLTYGKLLPIRCSVQ